MPSQRIILGDCLDVLANERNVPAIVADPPANIAFMGRSWDRAHPCDDYVLPCTPRSKAHERELRSEESFIRYWSLRYAMAYDIADQHAVAIIWTLPRTSYQTATALRRAGWDIRDNLVHLFGTGWAKTGNALAPGQEGWLLATKGKPDLDIDACRVPRGAGDVKFNPHKMSVNPIGWHRPWMNDPEAVEAANERSRQSQAKTQALGSLPKNALLSHCEECVRAGVKSVRQGGGNAHDHRGEKHGAFKIAMGNAERDDVHEGFGKTESVPAWHCLAGCVCGARSKWDPEQPLPTCPCGEVWRWICPSAEVNGQSGSSGTGKMVVGGPDRRNNGIMAARYNSDVARDRSDAIMSFGDQGGASRFFNTFSYLSKCSSSERHAGCENLYWRANKKNPFGFDQVTKEEWEGLSVAQSSPDGGTAFGRGTEARGVNAKAQGNVHPTVKSYRLMHWLHSLTGAKKIVDLCAGSGTGMITAALDGIEWIGAEMCPEAVTIAGSRYGYWTSLSLSALHAMITEGDTSKVIRMHTKYLDAIAAE